MGSKLLILNKQLEDGCMNGYYKHYTRYFFPMSATQPKFNVAQHVLQVHGICSIHTSSLVWPWDCKGTIGRAGIDDLLHLEEGGYSQHVLHILRAQTQLGCVHELQDLSQTCGELQRGHEMKHLKEGRGVNRKHTCSIADVQVYNILLVQEERAKVGAAGSQHGLVGFEVHAVHHKGTITQQPLLALMVQLL